MMNEPAESTTESAAASWHPLNAKQRRVLGVLVEKAKTTPEQYPLTINALRNGSNQKSNRAPAMQLEAEDVEEILEQLRELGIVIEVVSDGRVSKFRHKMYEWLGVDKVELAVMTELLLRGSQTLGELRGRAGRMEPIAGLPELRPVLDSLEAKGLITYLTPKGRGCIVTHSLYSPNEMDRQRRDHSSEGSPASSPVQNVAAPRSASPSPPPPVESKAMQAEVEELRRELNTCQSQIEQLREQVEQSNRELTDAVDDIKQQLGI